MTPTRPQILSRPVDDAAALASSTGLLSGWRSPCSPNPQAASLAWGFGEHFAVSAALSSALRVQTCPCVLSSGYALGGAPVFGAHRASQAPRCGHQTRSRWRLPMPLAQRLAATQPFRGSGYRPALYLQGFCFWLLPECPRWQFPISQWRVTLAGLARGLPEPPPHSPTDGWRLPLPRASLLLLRWPSSRATRSAPTVRRPLGPPSPASSAPVGPPSPLSGAPPCYAGERLCPFFSAGALSVK